MASAPQGPEEQPAEREHEGASGQSTADQHPQALKGLPHLRNTLRKGCSVANCQSWFHVFGLLSWGCCFWYLINSCEKNHVSWRFTDPKRLEFILKWSKSTNSGLSIGRLNLLLCCNNGLSGRGRERRKQKIGALIFFKLSSFKNFC